MCILKRLSTVLIWAVLVSPVAAQQPVSRQYDVQPALKSGSCNVDVICPEGDNWRDQIRSVGHYQFTTGGSAYVCTGSLINNTRNDRTPYFLTAHHCVDSQLIADTVVVYWEYESATCRTPGSGESGTPIPRPQSSQGGAMLRATDASSDFALLELDSSPLSTFNPFWWGWDLVRGSILMALWGSITPRVTPNGSPMRMIR